MRKPKGRNRTFQSHGAGKGCADRTSDDVAYRRNFDDINWGHIARAYKPVHPQKLVPVLYVKAAPKGPLDWDDELSSAGAHPIGFATWDGYYRAVDRRGKD